MHGQAGDRKAGHEDEAEHDQFLGFACHEFSPWNTK
jgi:hypothetical protein